VLIAEERSGGTVEALVGDELAALSVVTVSELLHGVHRADERHRLRRTAFVEAVLHGYVSVPITHRVARVHAELWAGLEAAGQPIGPHDLWIAATALTHDLGIATLDSRHFARVPGLRVVSQ
jgi:tRNA(fMet)-specific endonuclease VapC